MPTVPTIDEPQVQERGTPNVRFSTKAPELPAVSGQVAETVTKAVKGVAGDAKDFFLDQKKKADDARTIEADNEYRTAAMEELSAALNKKGEEAFGYQEKVSETLRKKREEIYSRLSNNDQRRAFERAAESRRQSVQEQLSRHISAEYREYGKKQKIAGQELSRTEAVLQAVDEQKVQESIQEQLALQSQLDDDDGASKEVRDFNALEVKSKTHRAVFSMLLTNGMAPIAKERFEKAVANKEMNDEDAKVIGDALKRGVMLGEAQTAAEEIVGRHSTLSDKAMKELKEKVKDPETLEKAIDVAKDRFAIKAASKKQALDNLYERMAKDLEGHKDITRLQKDTAWGVLDQSQRNALYTEYDRLIKGTDRANNDEKYLEFLGLSQGQLASMSMSDYQSNYRQHFSNAMQGKADSQMEAAKKGDEKNQLLSPFSTYKDRLDDTLRARKVTDPSNPKKSDKDAQLYSQLALSLREKVEHFETVDLQGKRRATGEEIQKIIDELAVKKLYVDVPWRRDPEKLAAVLTDEEKGQAYVPIKQVPDAEKSFIEKAFRARGKKPSTEQIQRAYGAVLLSDKKRLEQILAE